jgi:hypothetical protein
VSGTLSPSRSKRRSPESNRNRPNSYKCFDWWLMTAPRNLHEPSENFPGQFFDFLKDCGTALRLISTAFEPVPNA